MLSITGRPLLVLTSILAILALLGIAVLFHRVTRPGQLSRARRLALVVSVVVLAVLGQASAVVTSALAVNDSYGFYTSWADLVGAGPSQVAISTGGLVGRGQGTLRVATVHAHVDGLDDRVMVWLPPGYDAHAVHAYPVVMFLPGQPSSPQGTFRHFEFGKIATQLVLDHRLPPFIAVFPTLMIAPPRDTECTNIGGGVQAETWLNTDVPAYVQQHYRVQPAGKGWSLMGWSTGGFCAAKLLTSHPDAFGSAVAFGGYFTPIQDRTTGDLFGGQPRLYDHNSPLWLYLHDSGLRGSRLLLIAGRQDRQSWSETRRMIQAAAGDRAVSRLVFPAGGHNYKNYRSYLGQALVWGARTWPA
jgi:enterochelin esterase-like enzyme